MAIFNDLVNKYKGLLGQAQGFAQAHPILSQSPMAVANQQFQKRVAQPIAKAAPTWQAPGLKTINTAISKLPQPVQQPLRSAAPGLQIPEYATNLVNQYGRILSGKGTGEDIAFAALDFLPMVGGGLKKVVRPLAKEAKLLKGVKKVVGKLDDIPSTGGEITDIKKLSVDEYLKKRIPDIKKIEDNFIYTKDGNKIELAMNKFSDGLRINGIQAEKKGTGIGGKIVEALQEWTTSRYGTISIDKAYNSKFWKKMGFTGADEYTMGWGAGDKIYHPTSKPLSSGGEIGKGEAIKDKILYRGSQGEVEQTTQSFDNVLVVDTNQSELIKKLADEGNSKAKKLYDSLPNKDKVDFTIADPIIQEAYKDQYDAIQYNNNTPQLKAQGVTYFETKTGKSFAENELTAKQYARMNREEKYKEEQKVPKGFEIKEIVPEGSVRRVLNTKETQALQTIITSEMNHIRETSQSPKDMMDSLTKFYEDITTKAKDDKVVLSSLRTAISKEMFGMAGSTGKGYKADYANLQTMIKEDPENGPILSKMEDYVLALDQKLLSAKEVMQPKLEKEKKVVEKRETIPSKETPIGTGNLKESKLYKRIKSTLGAEAEAKEIKYNELSLDKQAEDVINLISDDPKKAVRIAKGYDEPPSGMSQNAVSIALAETARAKGDFKTAVDLWVKTSLRSTRLGQEIVSLRGAFDTNEPLNAIKKLLDIRIDRTLRRYNDIIKGLSLEEGASSMKKVDTLVKQKAQEVQKILTKAQKNIQSAQEIINALKCK